MHFEHCTWRPYCLQASGEKVLRGRDWQDTRVLTVTAPWQVDDAVVRLSAYLKNVDREKQFELQPMSLASTVRT